jgi:hypothetical protein
MGWRSDNRLYILDMCHLSEWALLDLRLLLEKNCIISCCGRGEVFIVIDCEGLVPVRADVVLCLVIYAQLLPCVVVHMIAN